MTRRHFHALALAVCAFCGLAALPAHAGGKAGEQASITFHIEADVNDNPKMLFAENVAGRKRIFRRLPEISTRDIADFAPFQAPDGQTYGVQFVLKDAAARRLAAITATNTDRYLLSRLNGRSMESVLIDGQISDGQLVIWKGVTALEIQQLDKLIPRQKKAKPKELKPE